ncbi:hypothetical protein [Corynebacterium pseudopelargi]|uniref:hypothetical protein n=1 Tax=Corynebacterium pseudopelargi TaxID=2080757 RepID=UPI000F511944|nr:hypothetical protein [Corynebacterium pseudopelargi]
MKNGYFFNACVHGGAFWQQNQGTNQARNQARNQATNQDKTNAKLKRGTLGQNAAFCLKFFPWGSQEAQQRLKAHRA